MTNTQDTDSTNSENKDNNDTLIHMIFISSVIGAVLIFVCVLNLLVHNNKTQILNTIAHRTFNVSGIVTNKVKEANAFLTTNKNYELAILFISLCVCTTIFVLNISLRDINCENKNCKNCNILVVLYNIFYIYFFLILIIYIFGNNTNNNTDNVNILIKEIINKINIIKNLKENRDRFITSLLFLGFLIVGQSISSYCDKFFDIDSVLLILVTILVGCLYILCLCISGRNIFEYKFLILIFILLVFNFIFKYIFIRGSKPLLNFDKKEEYDTFLIVIMVFILSLNLVNLIYKVYKVIKPYFNSNKL